MIGFGPHLTIDGYGCNKESLKDMATVATMLDKLPELIGMTKIMPPYTFTYSGLKPEDWGISGFVIIAESHIAIHTFPEKELFSFDIFSCKDFDVNIVINYIQNMFEPNKIDKHFLNRGTEFPRSIQESARLTTADRNKIIQFQN